MTSTATNLLIPDETVADIVLAGRTLEGRKRKQQYPQNQRLPPGTQFWSCLAASSLFPRYPQHPVPPVPYFAGVALLQKYKLLRAHLPTRQTFFDDLRALTRYLYFERWDHLLILMLQGLELDIPSNTS